MTRMNADCTRRVRALPLLVLFALTAAMAAGCDRDGPFAPPDGGPDGTRPAPAAVLGVVEVTITGLGTGEVSSSALSAPDVAALERLRAARDARARGAAAGGGLALESLAPPANLDASGDGTIQLEPLATGSFTHGSRVDGVGYRYLNATFRVRNAQKDGTPYDTPRQNLTFLAVATDGTGTAQATIGETAISALMTFDGTAITGPAAGTLAQAMLPTGAVKRTSAGALTADYADVLQVITEAEAAGVLAEAPTGVTTVFPYGFVTRCTSNCTDGRTLQEDPAPDQFDGIVTFAFRVPLQASAAGDPFEVRILFLAVDDTGTRVTESLEEQGTASVAAAADALGSAAGVTLLGNSTTAIASHGIRRICRVRTAGTDPNAPAATLVDASGCTAGTVTLPDHVVVVDDDAPAGGTGRAWPTAFPTLQDALACVRDESGSGQPCEGVDEIWVAEGIYYPDEGAGQTADSPGSRFELVDSIALYGGFAGGEYGRDQRDWTANRTVLDGDIDQDATATGNAANLLYVNVTGGARVTRAATVDGFTVRNGNGNGSAFLCVATGAGSECSPTLRNLVVTGNVGDDAGASAIVAVDGAIAAPYLEGIEFTDNEAVARGGAMFIKVDAGATASPTVVRATFDGNHGFAGGALAVIEEMGGAVDARFYNVEFRNNTADQRGGAASVSAGGAVQFFNAEFWNNRATVGQGGALHVNQGDVTLVNTTLAGNVAAQSGGAILTSIAGAELHLENTIVWGNAPDPMNLADGTATTAHSLIQGGCPAEATVCTDVIDADPGFADLVAGDLRLGGASPAVDAGDNDLVPIDIFDLDGDGNTTETMPDLAGMPRIVEWGGDDAIAIVDLGAYERQ